MKVGDKYLCKKELKIPTFQHSILFEKGKYYSISEFDNITISSFFTEGVQMNFNRTSGTWDYNFFDWFYTEREEKVLQRKEKIQKINEKG